MKAAAVIIDADGAVRVMDADDARCHPVKPVAIAPTLARVGEIVAHRVWLRMVPADEVADTAAELAKGLIEDGSGDVLSSLAEEDERAWEYICVQGGGWLGRAPVWRLSAVAGWTAWHIADAWCRKTGRKRARPGGDIRSWALDVGLGVTYGIKGGMDPERCAAMLGWK